MKTRKTDATPGIKVTQKVVILNGGPGCFINKIMLDSFSANTLSDVYN